MPEATGYVPPNQSFYDALMNSGYGQLMDWDQSYDDSLYNWNGRDIVGYDTQGNQIYENHEGITPFVGLPDGGNTFMSNDPDEIAAYQHDARTRFNQGALRIAALIGGGYLASGALGPTSGSGTATVSGSVTSGGMGAVPTGLGAVPSTAIGSQGLLPGVSQLGAGLGPGLTSGITGGAIGGGGALSGVAGFLGRYGGLIGDGLGALLGANAANNAVDAQTEANQQAIDLARENRDIFLGMNQPFYDASVEALGRMRDLSGMNPGADVSALVQADPSYQFRMQQQMSALENSAAARGGLLSGNFGNQALQLSGQYASQEYSNIYNRVAQIAGYGQQATANAGNAINNYTNVTTGAYNNMGMANASGYAAQGRLLMDLAGKLGDFDWSSIGRK